MDNSKKWSVLIDPQGIKQKIIILKKEKKYITDMSNINFVY
jgi:hypothetical protein